MRRPPNRPLLLAACGAAVVAVIIVVAVSLRGRPDAQPAAAVVAAVDRYHRAIVDGDYPAACAALTPQAQSHEVALAGRAGSPPVADCPTAMSRLVGRVQGADAAALDKALVSAQVPDLHVEGDQAIGVQRTFVNGKAVAKPFRAVRTHGRWQLDDAGGAG